jgi:Flp pilus assembly protein TadD
MSHLKAKGDLDGAIAEFRTALRLNPNHVAAHTNLGNALVVQGDFNEALDEYRTALRLNPSHVAAHVGMGVALKRLGRKGEAQGEFQQALQLLERVPGSEKKIETVRQHLREVE